MVSHSSFNSSVATASSSTSISTAGVVAVRMPVLVASGYCRAHVSISGSVAAIRCHWSRNGRLPLVGIGLKASPQQTLACRRYAIEPLPRGFLLYRVHALLFPGSMKEVGLRDLAQPFFRCPLERNCVVQFRIGRRRRCRLAQRPHAHAGLRRSSSRCTSSTFDRPIRWAPCPRSRRALSRSSC